MTDTIKPVAWVEVIDTDEGPYNFHGIRLLPKGRHHLYGPDVAALVRQLRDALSGCDALANGAFRALGDQPAGSEGQRLKTELACRSISISVALKAASAFLAQQENPAKSSGTKG